MQEKLALSIKEAGKILSVGRSTLFAEIRRGRLRAVKIGRRTLILWPDLKTFITLLAARQPNER